MIRFFLVFLVLVSAAPAIAQRQALVIGNGAYRNIDQLQNAPNDASDLSVALDRLGFSVTLGTNLERRELLTMVQSFAQGLRPGDTALFFFAGHGMQIGSDNYILPVDADGSSETALQDSSIRLQSVLASLEDRAATRIVILDACRDNPFPPTETVSRSTGVGRGFMKLDAGVGSFIAFSTAPGAVAADGVGRNSPFTEALLRHVGRMDENIHAVMRRVRADVMVGTNNRQIPWENSALIDEVFLSSAPAKTSAITPRPEPQQQLQLQPQTVPMTPLQPSPAMTHSVSGLDPNGDGFLALREGNSTSYRMTMMLTEGTPLAVLATDGQWFRVRTPEGFEGWAHSNWIRPTAAGGVSRQPAVSTGPTCDQLWYDRNAIFAANGYCFQSARGQAAFPNPSCRVGVGAADIPMSASDRSRVAGILAQEKAMGCR